MIKSLIASVDQWCKQDSLSDWLMHSCRIDLSHDETQEAWHEVTEGFKLKYCYFCIIMRRVKRLWQACSGISACLGAMLSSGRRQSEGKGAKRRTARQTEEQQTLWIRQRAWNISLLATRWGRCHLQYSYFYWAAWPELTLIHNEVLYFHQNYFVKFNDLTHLGCPVLQETLVKALLYKT